MVERPLLVAKAGVKPASLGDIPGDYEHWIAEAAGLDREQVVTVDVFRSERLPEPGSLGGVFVTGSAAMVDDPEPWIRHTAAWLGAAVAGGTPVLGICFGHQLLAHALGGRVENNPAGLEVGTVDVSRSAAAEGDPLFGALPARFPAHTTHVQTVTRLPHEARLTASSAMAAVQGFAYGRNAWGVQFHPEFDETIARAFVAFYRAWLADEGRDAGALLAQCRPAPESRRVLTRFVEICRV